jgi:hypothetical protein
MRGDMRAGSVSDINVGFLLLFPCHFFTSGSYLTLIFFVFVSFVKPLCLSSVTTQVMRLVHRASEVIITLFHRHSHTDMLSTPDNAVIMQQVRWESEQRDHACNLAKALALRVGHLESEKEFLQVVRCERLLAPANERATKQASVSEGKKEREKKSVGANSKRVGVREKRKEWARKRVRV